MLISSKIKRLILTILMGFSSGLPLALLGSSLQAWFTVSNVDLVTIGALSLVGQPYAFKFLWAPLMDHITLSRFGRRRSWLFLTQLALFILITVISFCDPATQPMLIASIALVTAFISASQDINVDAFRTDVLTSDERGLGAALYISGYRIAMLISGGLALVLAEHIGWHQTYQIMAMCFGVGLFATCWADEPESDATLASHSFKDAVIKPFQAFWKKDHAVLILIFIIMYKFSEAFSSMTGPLTTTFLIRGLGFDLSTVGTVNNAVGLLASLAGTFIAGALMTRISTYRALMGFGLFQAIANASFVLLAIIGKHYSLLLLAVCLDNLAYGMGSTALVAFLMGLCDKQFSATQFALLSSVAALSRIFMGPIGGIFVEATNWISFFAVSVLITFPPLVLLRWMNQKERLKESI